MERAAFIEDQGKSESIDGVVSDQAYIVEYVQQGHM